VASRASVGNRGHNDDERRPRTTRGWVDEEPDPRDLMRPYPAELTRIWPISTRVNKAENDDASILEPGELVASA